jgi:hypothetical protein
LWERDRVRGFLAAYAKSTLTPTLSGAGVVLKEALNESNLSFRPPGEILHVLDMQRPQTRKDFSLRSK